MVKRPKRPPPITYSPDAEWFKNRLNEKGISAAMLAKYLNVEPTIPRRIHVDGRQMRAHEVAIYANLLGVTPTEILRRLGLGTLELQQKLGVEITLKGSTCPVIGVVRGDGKIELNKSGKPQEVSSPVEDDVNLVALHVNAPHSEIAMWHGAYLYFEPSTVVRADAIGRLSVVEFGESAAPQVGVLERPAIGKGRIVPFGALDAVETEMMISATPVKWLRAG